MKISFLKKYKQNILMILLKNECISLLKTLLKMDNLNIIFAGLQELVKLV